MRNEWLANLLIACVLALPVSASAWVAGRTVVGPNGGVVHSGAAGVGRPLPPPPAPYYHPVARAAAVTAAVVTTAVVVGSIVHSLPPSCTTVVSAGITYQHCGSSWYQPQYVGTTVQYVVVVQPH
jgi:hypothetical protein